MGDWFVIKGSYANFGREDLEFGQLDVRLRKALGSGWNLTLGSNLRGHPAYGLFPFDKWVKDNNNRWWELAYLYGYYDEQYIIDEDWSDFNWYNEYGE